MMCLENETILHKINVCDAVTNKEFEFAYRYPIIIEHTNILIINNN